MTNLYCSLCLKSAAHQYVIDTFRLVHKMVKSPGIIGHIPKSFKQCVCNNAGSYKKTGLAKRVASPRIMGSLKKSMFVEKNEPVLIA